MRFLFPVKILVLAILTIVFFLGEITSTFSFKRESDRNLSLYPAKSFAYKLSNDRSLYAGTLAVDSIFSSYLKKKNIKGASIAITHKGKLVYAKGLGFSNVMDSIKTEPWNLFRIASASKLITAAAIMKLSENGSLNLDDKVFGKDGWLNDSIYLDYKDKDVESITIRHLLTHASGWNHRSFDPVFAPWVFSGNHGKVKQDCTEDLIRFTLSRKLDFKPGSKYSYSNTGYCILGVIIKKASGMSYEDYVQFALLHPLGIYDMHIGKSFPEDMPAEEVIYYVNGKLNMSLAYDGSGQRVPLQYGGNNIELLGPAGGWVASAPEMAKLIVAIDGFSNHQDILSKHSIRTMTRDGNKKVSQLLGWRGTEGETWWRTGTLAGTVVLIMRFDNETNWVVMLNTTSDKKSRVHNELSRAIYQCLAEIKDWPTEDLFNL